MFSRWCLIIILPLLAGCLGPVTELYPDKEEKRPVPAYIVSHGWHVGIALERQYLIDKLPDHEQLPKTDFWMIGWGDNKYYPSERARVDLLLRAAFLPTGSVIHVVGFDEAVQAYFINSDIVRVRLSRQGMEQMAEHIAEQFQKETEDSLKYVAAGLYTNSSFFEAKGLYFFPKTSNRWTARTLRKSGFPISPFYAITSGNVIRQVRKSGEVIQRR